MAVKCFGWVKGIRKRKRGLLIIRAADKREKIEAFLPHIARPFGAMGLVIIGKGNAGNVGNCLKEEKAEKDNQN